MHECLHVHGLVERSSYITWPFFSQNWSCNKSSGPIDLLCQVKALKKDNTTEAAAAGCWSIQQDN